MSGASLTAQTDAPKPKRGRGRPPKAHDNRRVQAYLRDCGLLDRGKHFTALPSQIPWLADVLTAVANAQTSGANSKGPLNSRLIFKLLLLCSVIGATTIADVLPRDYSTAQLGRYALASEVASQQIERYLERRPEFDTVDYKEWVGEYFSL